MNDRLIGIATGALVAFGVASFAVLYVIIPAVHAVRHAFTAAAIH